MHVRFSNNLVLDGRPPHTPTVYTHPLPLSMCPSAHESQRSGYARVDGVTVNPTQHVRAASESRQWPSLRHVTPITRVVITQALLAVRLQQITDHLLYLTAPKRRRRDSALTLTPISPSAPSISAATALIKDGVTCTMCASCDNPCQPLPSPPPPPPTTATCPPPPSSVYYPAPPPPNPFLPYFPFYYYSPPPPGNYISATPPSINNPVSSSPPLLPLLLLLSPLLFL
ncbi:extensin-like [Ananas comosus]|uniref:Extensin-like n=1 Tax=Ananas comosus TaxID=4615 RepID=A0A6P5EY74_ANACO|nr:extensin-like [Ananas comosus]